MILGQGIFVFYKGGRADNLVYGFIAILRL